MTRRFLGVGCVVFAAMWGTMELVNWGFNGDKPLPFYGNAFIYVCLAYLLLEKR